MYRNIRLTKNKYVYTKEIRINKKYKSYKINEIRKNNDKSNEIYKN